MCDACVDRKTTAALLGCTCEKWLYAARSEKHFLCLGEKNYRILRFHSHCVCDSAFMVAEENYLSAS